MLAAPATMPIRRGRQGQDGFGQRDVWLGSVICRPADGKTQQAGNLGDERNGEERYDRLAIRLEGRVDQLTKVTLGDVSRPLYAI